MQRVTIYYNQEMSNTIQKCKDYGIKVTPHFREFVEKCDMRIVKENVVPRKELWTNRSYEVTPSMTQKVGDFCQETGMSRCAVYTALLNAFLKNFKNSSNCFTKI